MVAEFSEFKGNKMLVLKKSDDDKYPFQFGKNKAKLIMEHISDIEAFANEE